MYKLYHNNFSGQDPYTWDVYWQDNDVNESLLYAAYNNPYKVDFDKFCLPGKNVIEAGCGFGRFVIYYAKKGCRIVGIDFAERTVKFLQSKIKGIPIEYGSVEDLPYQNNIFDVYLSIGVMEHFEIGPHNVLKEARRVLKPEGYLVLIVPYINISKAMRHKINRIKQRLYKNSDSLLKFDNNCYYEEIKNFIKGERRDFLQYEFTKKELLSLMLQNRFKIICIHGCSIAYGLNYVPFIGRALYNWMRVHMNKNKKINSPSGDNIQIKELNFDSLQLPLYKRSNFLYEFVKEILIRENTNNLLLRPLIRFLQEFCGDFLLVVCRPSH